MSLIPLRDAHRRPGCGGKAAGLGRLIAAGRPTLPGVVIPDACFQAFLRAHDLGGLRAEPERFVAGLSAGRFPAALRAELAAALRTLGPGPFVARSSGVGEDGARASFAGQLETVFDLGDLDEVVEGVRRVWASWARPTLRAYEAARGEALHGLGVIVQPQLTPTAAGVLFTRAPDAPDELLIEYAAGRGDALVAGRVEPGQLRFGPGGEVRARAAAGDYELPDEVGAELARLARALEAEAGGPLDVEWAWVDGAPVLLQARPVTGPAPTVRWTRVNLEENFPEPLSPLLASIAVDGYRHLFRNVGRAFGVSPARLEALEAPLAEVVGLHGGRLYYNLSAIHEVIEVLPGGGWLAEAFDRFVGAPEEPNAEAAPLGWRERLEAGRVLGHALEKALRLEPRVRAFEERAELFASRTANERLAERSLPELREDLRGFLALRTVGWGDASLADTAAVVATAALRKTLAAVAPDEPGLASELLQGVGALVSSAPAQELWAISRRVHADPALRALFAEPAERVVAALFEEDVCPPLAAALRGYLSAWGFRCTGELMLTVPSLEERPAAVIPILAAYAALPDDSPRSPAAVAARQRAAYEARLAALRSSLAGRRVRRWLPRPTLAGVATAVVRRARRALADRERVRLKQALLYGRCRAIARAIGARLVEAGVFAAPDDVFFFAHTDLDALLADPTAREVAPEVAARRAALAAQTELDPPRDLRLAPGRRWQAAPRGEPAADGELCGVGAAPGRAEGAARVLRSLVEAGALSAGDVLVTTHTDPGWGPVFLLLGGLVLERGGLLSHGAILAREFAVPTVVGVPRATERIAPGAAVVVDGDAGRVELVEAAAGM